MLGGVLMLILAPIAAELIQMAISRTREFRPTRRRPSTPERPDGLIGACEAGRLVEADPDGRFAGDRAHVHHQAVQRRAMMKLFSTHPPPKSASRACRRPTSSREAVQGKPQSGGPHRVRPSLDFRKRRGRSRLRRNAAMPCW